MMMIMMIAMFVVCRCMHAVREKDINADEWKVHGRQFGGVGVI